MNDVRRKCIGSFADGVLHREGEGDLVNDGLVSRGDDQNRVGAVLLCGQRSQGGDGGHRDRRAAGDGTKDENDRKIKKVEPSA